MKQYLPKKTVKRGFKVWVMADSSNGYFLDLQVYVGRDFAGSGDNRSGEKGLGARVVLGLSEPLAGCHYHIYCDNFFSSPKLFMELLSRGLYACGTVRTNRVGFPNDLKTNNLSRGEIAVRQSGNLTATIWKDKRVVSVLSTLSQPADTVEVIRRERNNSVSITCPTAITTYNAQMAGVDVGDQIRKYYSVRLKCNKNYKYIFWFLFDVSITNAFLLSKYCVSVPPSLEFTRLKQFRVSLAKSLIGDYCTRQRAERPSTGRSFVAARPLAVLPPRHFPHHDPRRRCTFCQHYRKPSCRRESVWHCTDCQGSPTLCLTGRDDGSDCWRLWHEQIQDI